MQSCLSGIRENHAYQYYRLLFPVEDVSARHLLHFGAVDWRADVWLNRKCVHEIVCLLVTCGDDVVTHRQSPPPLYAARARAPLPS